MKFDELKPGDIINLGNNVPSIIFEKTDSQVRVAQFIDHNYMIVVSGPLNIHDLKIVKVSRDKEFYKELIKKAFEYDVHFRT
jgi:PII-like signaling protein